MYRTWRPAWTALLLGFTVAIAFPSSAKANAGGQYAYNVTGVDATGMKRLSREQVVALAGLEPGRAVRPADVEAAKMRLIESGLFSSVAYRFRNALRSVTVVFSVEEAPWQAEVLFDNFVGIDEAELRRAVAAEIPTFDGAVPENPAALDRVRAALERAARDAGQPGDVSYLLVTDRFLRLRRYRYHLYRQAGEVPVCSVELKGVSDGLRSEMTANTASLVGADYSRDFVTRHAMQNLLAVERREGYLQARVVGVDAARQETQPNAAGSSSGCKNGVRVSVTVDEGVQYTWQSPTWKGNTVLAQADLERLLGIATGERADGTKIDRGLKAVTDAYRNKGHLAVSVQTTPAFDDAGHAVTYAISIVEGGQFRMGTLEILGLDPALTGQVKASWELPEGDVFDASYPTRFLGAVRNKLRQMSRFQSIDVQTRPGAGPLTVNVTLTFKSSS